MGPQKSLAIIALLILWSATEVSAVNMIVSSVSIGEIIPDTEVEVIAKIIENDDILSHATLWWTLDVAGRTGDAVNMTRLNGTHHHGFIPGYPVNTTVYFNVVAWKLGGGGVQAGHLLYGETFSYFIEAIPVEDTQLSTIPSSGQQYPNLVWSLVGLIWITVILFIPLDYRRRKNLSSEMTFHSSSKDRLSNIL